MKLKPKNSPSFRYFFWEPHLERKNNSRNCYTSTARNKKKKHNNENKKQRLDARARLMSPVSRESG